MAGTLNSKTPTAQGTPPAPSPPDRTSAVVGTTLIFLTVLGILTVFWEPLTAFAVGTPSGSEPAAESHASTVDAGEAATTPADGSSNS